MRSESAETLKKNQIHLSERFQLDLPVPEDGFTRKQSNPLEGQRGVGSREHSRTAQGLSVSVPAPYYSHLCNALGTQIF